MARVSLIEKEKASGNVQEVLGEIEGAFGKVPNLFRAYSHYPPLLLISA